MSEKLLIQWQQVELPLSNGSLDPRIQWDLLICHLFVKCKRSISAITRLGIDRARIIRALLEYGAIEERRHGSQAPPSGTPPTYPLWLEIREKIFTLADKLRQLNLQRTRLLSKRSELLALGLPLRSRIATLQR